jgi:predicted nuclease of restriction endonuclease-like (RecB) superfamily
LTTKLQIFVEYDTLGRQYSISALMKRNNITEMHIYVKYEIVSFMRRQFSSLKVYIKIGQNKKNKKTQKTTKVGICTKTVLAL